MQKMTQNTKLQSNNRKKTSWTVLISGINKWSTRPIEDALALRLVTIFILRLLLVFQCLHRFAVLLQGFFMALDGLFMVCNLLFVMVHNAYMLLLQCLYLLGLLKCSRRKWG